MKFLLDANIPYSLQEVFPKGHNVYHVRDLNLANAQDQEIAKYAKKNKAVIVSRDLDFGNINNFPPENYYGIIILTFTESIFPFQSIPGRNVSMIFGIS